MENYYQRDIGACDATTYGYNTISNGSDIFDWFSKLPNASWHLIGYVNWDEAVISNGTDRYFLKVSGYSSNKTTTQYYLVVPNTQNFQKPISSSENIRIGNYSLTVPEGWIVYPRYDTKNAFTFVKNDFYKLTITEDARNSGAAACEGSRYNLTSHGVILKRQIPPAIKAGSSSLELLTLDVCEPTQQGYMLGGSATEDIEYLIPGNYDPKILREMDTIVESIK